MRDLRHKISPGLVRLGYFFGHAVDFGGEHAYLIIGRLIALNAVTSFGDLSGKIRHLCYWGQNRLYEPEIHADQISSHRNKHQY